MILMQGGLIFMVREYGTPLVEQSMGYPPYGSDDSNGSAFRNGAVVKPRHNFVYASGEFSRLTGVV